MLTVMISFGFTYAYADEIVAVTVDLQTILLDADEVIPLLNTNNIANMSKVTVSATLPCNSSDVPSLKIIGGILGNTTDIISSSDDYVDLRGPFDTCLFEDTLDVSNSTIPALNRIFLQNDGTDSVLTSLGTTVTLTGIISENNTQSSPETNSTTYFSEDFTGCTTDTCNGSLETDTTATSFIDTTTNSWEHVGDNHASWHDASWYVGDVSDDKWQLKFNSNYHSESINPTGYSHGSYFGLSSADHETNRSQAQDSVTAHAFIDNLSSRQWQYAYSDDAQMNSNAVNTGNDASTDDDNWCWLFTKDGDSLTRAVYSDEDCTTEVSSTVTDISGESLTGLDYLVFKSGYNSQQDPGNVHWEVYNIELCSGATDIDNCTS